MNEKVFTIFLVFCTILYSERYTKMVTAMNFCLHIIKKEYLVVLLINEEIRVSQVLDKDIFQIKKKGK